MNKKYILLIIVIINIEMFSQYKLSGFASVGYSYVGLNQELNYTQQTSFGAKLLLEYNINKHIDARIDFRANSRRQTVELREVSIGLDYFDYLKFSAGNLKKPFGGETIENIENLSTVGRSYLTQEITKIGYGGRAIGLEAYYKYSKVQKDYPHSYYLFIYRNNDVETGLVARYTRVFDDISFSGNYFLLRTLGEYPITTHAASIASNLSLYGIAIEGEILFAQDPVEGIKRIKKNENEEVYIIGGKLSSSYLISIEDEFIKAVQPVLLFSYYLPDAKVWDEYTLQFLSGADILLDDNVKFRVNGDVLLTKDPKTKIYKGHDARLILNLQIKF